MKQLVLGVVLLWSLLPVHSAAQHGGGVTGAGSEEGQSAVAAFLVAGFIGTGFSGHGGFRNGQFGLPPVGPIPPLDSMGIHKRFRRHGYGSRGLGWGYSGAFDGYGDAGYYDSGYQSPMVGLPEEENCGPTFIQPPPPPARPELLEYKWPDSTGDTATIFVFMSTDGTVRPAIAVWVQGSTVHYFTPDGAGGRLGLHSVNREGTRLANAAKHLTLWLPAGG